MSRLEALLFAQKALGGKRTELVRKTWKMPFSGNRYSLCYLYVDGVIRGVGKDWKDTVEGL